MNIKKKLEQLMAMSQEAAFIELSQLHRRMELNEWYELCDEYATQRAEKNKPNKQ